MTEAEVQDLIVDTLSTLVGTGVDELKQQLELAGATWPYDSILLAEVLVVVEVTLGITLPMDADTASALRSVRGLATRIALLAPECAA